MNTKIKRIKEFFQKLTAALKKDDIFSAANDLTYRIFFSAFPFAIFLMSIMGFMHLDEKLLTEQLVYILPDIVNNYAEPFINQITNRRDANILSFSLIVAIYSASSGFRTVTRSINKAYGLKDTRKFYFKLLISIALVLIFGGIIILCFVLLIFGNIIFYAILPGNYIFLFNILRYIISVIILFFSVILINKIALFKIRKSPLKNLFFGTLFTCASWIAASMLFNIYIYNFSNFSVLYGSVGAVIILMLWINIMCISLLIGSVINAILEHP